MDRDGARRPLAMEIDVTDAPARQASIAEFYKMDPQETDWTTKTWITRGANFLVAVSEVQPGSVLRRDNNPDEYMMIVPPGVQATIEAGEERIEAEPDSLTIVPPGPSAVIITSADRRPSSRSMRVAVRSKRPQPGYATMLCT